MEKLIDVYLSGNISEWCDLGWSPATPCQMVNGGFRLWGHQFIYDAEELKLILHKAGFQKIIMVNWHESTNPALSKLECRPFRGEIIIEATK